MEIHSFFTIHESAMPALWWTPTTQPWRPLSKSDSPAYSMLLVSSTTNPDMHSLCTPAESVTPLLLWALAAQPWRPFSKVASSQPAGCCLPQVLQH